MSKSSGKESDDYSLSASKMSNSELRKVYESLPRLYTNLDLDKIFEVALNDRSLFPSIHGVSDERTYLFRWKNDFIKESEALPSKNIKSPKSTCDDPAIEVLVKDSGHVDESHFGVVVKSHNLCMSAENVIGRLLEEYIANETHKFGILWCRGKVLRAVDFCSTDGALLLQVKNKYNTENSSSSAIRDGTDIKNWFRLDVQVVKKVKTPKFRWDELNEMINEHKTECLEVQCCMSEKGFEEFLSQVAKCNSKIINPN